jgi:hypothetical protein
MCRKCVDIVGLAAAAGGDYNLKTVAVRLGHGGGGTTTLRVYTAWHSETDQRAAGPSPRENGTSAHGRPRQRTAGTRTSPYSDR